MMKLPESVSRDERVRHLEPLIDAVVALDGATETYQHLPQNHAARVAATTARDAAMATLQHHVIVSGGDAVENALRELRVDLEKQIDRLEAERERVVQKIKDRPNAEGDR